MSLLYKDLLNIAETRFTEANCLTPRLDAEVLLCHMLGKDKSFIFSHYGNLLDEDACEQFFRIADVRASGVPVQYITGKQEFMGLPFFVNEDVLIPRQDTETLVESAINELKARKPSVGGFRVLDLCCGSGAVAVSLAAHLAGSKIKLTAADISEKAIAVAEGNARRNGVAGEIKFIQGDLFAPFKTKKDGTGKKQFDMIVSNPPYIPTGVLPTLMREVREHEPLLALDGGKDGIDFYIRILGEAPAHLKKNGLLMLEIGFDQAAIVTALAEAAGAFGPVTIIKDLAGHDRVARIERK
jgi:release factor glutamine methyltransferase